MTTTEALHFTDQQELSTSAEVAEAVLAKVEELADPTTEAHRLFYEVPGVNQTELTEARRPAGGHTVLLKDETAHFVALPDGEIMPVQTFKRRGARAAAIFALQEQPELDALVSASAGGHGQGVAAAALEFGLDCEVHTKRKVSAVKAERMSALDADVLSIHKNLPTALEAAEASAGPDTGKAFIHPYDQIETIAGPGTLGLEVWSGLRQRELAGELDLRNDPVDIVLPLGGGGLVTGVAVAMRRVKDLGLAGDNLRVVAVSAGNKEQNAWVDGTQTTTGELTSLVVDDPDYVQEHLTVSDLEVANAMYELTGVYHKRIEPAGALAYAGVQRMTQAAPTRDGHPRKMFVAPVTGASVTPEAFQVAMDLRNEAYHANLSALGNLATYDIGESVNVAVRSSQASSSPAA
jgi:threonine dehydratase